MRTNLLDNYDNIWYIEDNKIHGRGIRYRHLLNLMEVKEMAEKALQKVTLKLEGMSCASCAQTIENTL
ncbi:MAG: heavy-metal-associated domain-containing protein, partial [Halanaerobiales bacterium]